MPKSRKLHPSWALICFNLGVIAGDIFMHLTRTTFFAAVPWLIAGLVALILSLKISTKPTLLLAAAAGIILIANRAAPDFISAKNLEAITEAGTAETAEITAEIAKDPDISDEKIALVLKDPVINGEQQKGKIYATLSAKSQTEADLRRYDEVTLEAKIDKGFGTYSAYLYHPKITAVRRSETPLLDLRDNFATEIREALNDTQASGLALGYLLGIRTGLDEDLEEALRTVGLTHIIVASGTHLGILVGFARKLFGKLSRFTGFFAAIIFILAFFGITGLTPSMTRAALVAALSLFAWYLGRDRSPVRVLLFAAAATLLYAPTNLLDLAWLLSFASFAGIMLLSPLLTKFFFGDSRKKPGLLTETLLSSLAASLACAPILLYLFGSISLISILANLLILPTISVTLGLTFLTGLLATIAIKPLTTIAATLTKLLLTYHITIVDFLGQNDYFLIKITPNEPRIFLLYLAFTPLLIWALSRYFRIRTPRCRPH